MAIDIIRHNALTCTPWTRGEESPTRWAIWLKVVGEAELQADPQDLWQVAAFWVREREEQPRYGLRTAKHPWEEREEDPWVWAALAASWAPACEQVTPVALVGEAMGGCCGMVGCGGAAAAAAGMAGTLLDAVVVLTETTTGGVERGLSTCVGGRSSTGPVGTGARRGTSSAVVAVSGAVAMSSSSSTGPAGRDSPSNSTSSSSASHRGEGDGVQNASDSSASDFGGGRGMPSPSGVTCIAMTTSSVARRDSGALVVGSPMRGGRTEGAPSGPEVSMFMGVIWSAGPAAMAAAGKSAVCKGAGTGPVPESTSMGV
eukprot:6476414-Amphidinium_carterae.1